LEENCGFCDNCVKPKEQFEAKEDIVLALKAVLLTEERFWITHLSSILSGIHNDYTHSYKHDQLEVFGKGKDKKIEYWNSVIRQILLLGYLEKDIDNYGVLKITSKGQEYLTNPETIVLSKDHDYTEEAAAVEEIEKEHVNSRSYDPALFEMLKALRKKIAKEKNLPPYVIFQDPSLEEMATTYPTTKEELLQINGVGSGKAIKFGKPFIELISKFVEENDIVTASDVVVKSSVNKSKIKIFIIQQIDRKIDLDEIAQSKDLAMTDIVEEIEHICYSGTKLNLDYYIDQLLDQEKQEEIFDYFMQAENDSIKIALEELGQEFSEEELRLMRVKFLSEIAN
jgi:ATP-dependent DNA helicase RecQ